MAGDPPTLLREYQREYGPGFHPLRLWRDRQAILAEPALAAQPNPPLANAPVRFSLSLMLTPVIVCAWLVSVAVGVLTPEGARHDPLAERTTPVIERLRDELGGIDGATAKAEAETTRIRDLPPPARALAQRGLRLQMERGADLSGKRAAVDAWLRDVQAAGLEPAQRRQVLVEVYDSALGLARGDRLFADAARSVAEGGPAMQALIAISMLFSAWLFGQMVRGTPRFTRAAHADRFYLYYSTSRMFWFVPLTALAYGYGSYASARGDAAAMASSQVLQGFVGLASLVWLLLASGTMARALSDGAADRRIDAWAIAWRQLVAYAVSFAALVVLIVIAAFAVMLAVALID